jgi:hypothetical protein
MTHEPRPEIDDVLVQRVCGEFLEMPGMRLTPKQAGRLWGLDERTCIALLEFLVDEKFLSRSRDGGYGRCTDGAMPFPRPRMAKAGLDAADRRSTKSAASN